MDQKTKQLYLIKEMEKEKFEIKFVSEEERKRIEQTYDSNTQKDEEYKDDEFSEVVEEENNYSFTA